MKGEREMEMYEADWTLQPALRGGQAAHPLTHSEIHSSSVHPAAISTALLQARLPNATVSYFSVP